MLAMVVTSRAPLFILLASLSLTAMQGCGPDCPALLEESGIPDEDEKCGMGPDTTAAPGRRLEAFTPVMFGHKYKNVQSKINAIESQVRVVKDDAARALSEAPPDMDKMVQEMMAPICEGAQKMIDCYSKPDGLCACTCAELNPESAEDDCKGEDDEDQSAVTIKEMLDNMIEELGKEACVDKAGIDNTLENTCP